MLSWKKKKNCQIYGSNLIYVGWIGFDPYNELGWVILDFFNLFMVVGLEKKWSTQLMQTPNLKNCIWLLYVNEKSGRWR